MIKNLTDKNITIEVEIKVRDGVEHVDAVFPLSPNPAYVFYDREPSGTVALENLQIPRTHYTKKRVENLPHPADDTFLIVEQEVAFLYPERTDLLVATEEGFIRYV